VKLTDPQSLRIAEPPEYYPVVERGRSVRFLRRPSGQVRRIQQNGRLTAATTEAKCRLADGRADARLLADGVPAMTPYTGVSG
jgi:hypothetical protein